MAKLADLIWKNAGLLRGAFKEHEYRKVILPFTILRRPTCVLTPSRERVPAKCAKIKSSGYDLDKMLKPTSGYPPFNHPNITLPGVAECPTICTAPPTSSRSTTASTWKRLFKLRISRKLGII